MRKIDGADLRMKWVFYRTKSSFKNSEVSVELPPPLNHVVFSIRPQLLLLGDKGKY